MALMSLTMLSRAFDLSSWVSMRVPLDLSCWASMRVSADLSFELHLNRKETEEGEHHDHAGHCRIVLNQYIGQTWIVQGCERGRHKLCSNELKVFPD